LSNTTSYSVPKGNRDRNFTEEEINVYWSSCAVGRLATFQSILYGCES